MDGKKTILSGRRIDNQYVSFIHVIPLSASVKIARLIELCHQRLGHVNDNVTRAMMRNNLVDDLEVTLMKRNGYDSCHFEKQITNPTRGKRKCLSGQCFHSDVWHVRMTSWNKSKFLTLKNETFGYRKVYFVKLKDEVSRILKEFSESKRNWKESNFTED